MLVFVLTRLCYSACNIFYDSMLVDVTSDERMDRVSSYGYALGYIGSCIPFVIGILLILVRPFGLSTQTATQISFVITALWWAALTVPLLKNVQQTHYLERRENQVKHAFSRVGQTLKKIRQKPAILYFIIAYFCYIDGVYTIISMATTYGGEVGISDTSMILALLLTQFVAFPCAIFAGRLAEKIGTLKVIRISILIYCGICIFGYQLDQSWEFWVLAVIVGMAQGGIQSPVPLLLWPHHPKRGIQRVLRLLRYLRQIRRFLRPAHHVLLRAGAGLLHLRHPGAAGAVHHRLRPAAQGAGGKIDNFIDREKALHLESFFCLDHNISCCIRLFAQADDKLDKTLR